MTLSLCLRNVGLRTNTASLLEGFDLTIGPGEIVTLMGPSGCGKSSLLAWMSGALSGAIETTGTIELGGQSLSDLPPEQRGIGILFQDDMLFPHMDVLGNLLFAVSRKSPKLASRSTRDRRQKALEALQAIGLAELANRRPQTLSGGQKARIALIRALLAEPRALLLDEPFSALDQELRREIRQFVFGHIKERGLPALLVTHDQADADAAGGRVLRPWGS